MAQSFAHKRSQQFVIQACFMRHGAMVAPDASRSALVPSDGFPRSGSRCKAATTAVFSAFSLSLDIQGCCDQPVVLNEFDALVRSRTSACIPDARKEGRGPR